MKPIQTTRHLPRVRARSARIRSGASLRRTRVAAVAFTALLAALASMASTASASAQPVGEMPVLAIEALSYNGEEDCENPVGQPGPYGNGFLRPVVYTLCFSVSNIGSGIAENAELTLDGPDFDPPEVVQLGDLPAGETVYVRRVIDQSTTNFAVNVDTVPADSGAATQALTSLIETQVISAQQYFDYLDITDVFSLVDAQPGETEVDVQTQLDKWTALGIDSYEITWFPTCFCYYVPGFEPPYTAQVINGEVVSVVVEQTGEAADIRSVPTVEDLFASIRNATERPAYRTDARFHAVLGYPTSWYADYDPFIADEEYGVVVESLTPLVPCGDEYRPVDDCAPTIHTSCLLGNGRADMNVVNHSDNPAIYEMRYGTLSPRRVLVPAHARGRISITGRADDDYYVEVLLAGEPILQTTSSVRCDAAVPSVSEPVLTVVSACLQGRGHVTFQFVNDNDSPETWLIEFGSLARRSTSARAYGATIHGISGRSNGDHTVRIFSAGPDSEVLFDGVVNVDC